MLLCTSVLQNGPGCDICRKQFDITAKNGGWALTPRRLDGSVGTGNYCFLGVAEARFSAKAELARTSALGCGCTRTISPGITYPSLSRASFTMALGSLCSFLTLFSSS